MEILDIVTIPGWLITVTIVISILYLYSKWKLSVWKSLGVPGPDPIPYIGNMRSYYKKGTCLTELEYVKKYGDVVGLYQCHRPVLLVADPEMIKEIFIKEFSNFTNRSIPFEPPKRAMSGIALAMDTHWKFLRSTLSPTFTSGKVKLMMAKIHKCCGDLVDNIKSQSNNGEPVDMKEACGGYTMDIISSTSFGIEVNSQKEPNNKFVHYAKKAAAGELASPFILFLMMFPFLRPLGALRLRKREVVEFFDSVLNSAIKIRQEGKEEYHDFLQLMLNARHTDYNEEANSKTWDLQSYRNRGLNILEIQANANTFFIAGYDTTANTLSFACYCLATNPDVQTKVFEEINDVLNGEKPQYDTIGTLQYLDRFLSEVLRLYGAAVRINRECKKDIIIKGVHIPKGTDVTMPIFAIHRNPKFWPEPEKFDPDRFTEENKAKRPEYSYVPFGIGPRICLGMRLALMEAKMAIVYMVQNFTFSTCEETEIPVTFDKGIILRAENGILLKINQRSPK